MNWISIKEKKPFAGQYVLFCGGSIEHGITLHTQYGFYAGENEENKSKFVVIIPIEDYSASKINIYTTEVTHWMEFPEAFGGYNSREELIKNDRK